MIVFIIQLEFSYEQDNDSDLDRQGYRKERAYSRPKLVDAKGPYADGRLGAGGG